MVIDLGAVAPAYMLEYWPKAPGVRRTEPGVALTSSKVAIGLSLPFSSTTKSSFVRPATCPDPLVTTTGTCTSSVREMNFGVSFCGTCLSEALPGREIRTNAAQNRAQALKRRGMGHLYGHMLGPRSRVGQQ